MAGLPAAATGVRLPPGWLHYSGFARSASPATGSPPSRTGGVTAWPRDAELIEFYLEDVIGAGTTVMVAHDRGDSMALVQAAQYAQGRPATEIKLLILSNGNIFLPLSNLTQAQRLVLDAQSWPHVAAALTPQPLAESMGATTFTPPRKAGDPEVEAMTAAFSYHNGVQVLHETIQYLAERSEKEQSWLTALAGAPFPVTMIWGLRDTVSPPRVASYVWNEYLMLKPGTNSLYFIPDANHYLQADRPDAFVTALLHALDPGDDHQPGALGPEPAAPLLVDTSRPPHTTCSGSPCPAGVT